VQIPAVGAVTDRDYNFREEFPVEKIQENVLSSLKQRPK
jgi:hypothetical protein